MADSNNIQDNSLSTTQRLITANSGTQVFSNTATDTSYSLDRTDTTDVYRLRLNRASSLILTLGGLTGNANLEFLQSDGTGTAEESSLNTGTLADAVVTGNLSAGDYYIRVSLPDPNVSTNYTLSVSTIGQTRADLLWRNYASGTNAIWEMNGSELGASTPLPRVADPNWRVDTTADMDGDGQADLIWRNLSTGTNAIWYMDSSNGIKSVGILPAVADSNWQIAGVGHFNNDQQLDIVWRNYSTGVNAVWFMNGLQIASVELLTQVSDPNWRIATVVDLDQDGKSDLIWRNYANGINAFWKMNGVALESSTTFIPVNDVNWVLEGTGDFNADGVLDFVWRNYSFGTNAVWLMGGADRLQIQSVPLLTNVSDPNWQIASIVTVPKVVDLAGNTLSSALDVGKLSGEGRYADKIGGTADRDDFYKFSIDLRTRLDRLDVTLAPDAKLQLIQDLNNNGLVDTGEVVQPTTGEVSAITGLTLEAGTYFIRVYSNGATATNYSLNLNATTIQPTNLTPTLVQVLASDGTPLAGPIDLNVNRQVRVRYRVNNTSNTSSPNFSVGFYVSRDNVITTDPGGSDKLFLTSPIPSPLNLAGETQYEQVINLPPASDTWWQGDQLYYLGIFIDSTNQVIELNETDNVLASTAFQITGTTRPDLTGGTLTVNPGAGQPTSSITLNGSVNNTGGGTVNNTFDVTFRFSSDSVFSSNDFNLGTVALNGPLAPGGSVTISPAFNFAVPARTWSGWRGNGTYYVIGSIDSGSQIVEGNENNNFFFTTINITGF